MAADARDARLVGVAKGHGADARDARLVPPPPPHPLPVPPSAPKPVKLQGDFFLGVASP